MKSENTLEKLKHAIKSDPTIVCPRDTISKVLGSDKDYLNDILGLDKSTMIRLERLGIAVKARYATENKKRKCTGPHRVRWLIIQEEVERVSNL